MNTLPALPPFFGRHLYVHIPNCAYRCDYCDFFTRTGVAPMRQREIVRRIGEQLCAVISPEASTGLETIYVGGGTPSSLAAPAWESMLAVIASYVSETTAEVTVEVNPEDVTVERLNELRSAGVSRISFGIQSFQNRKLEQIGRHTTLAATRRGVETLATFWDRRWSGDLIVGTPGETDSETAHDVRTILEYEPTHVSLYELSVEPGTRLARRVARGGEVIPIEDDVAIRRLRRAESILEENGLAQYEISNFAVPGAESKHNLAYWRYESYLGVGPGAVGTYRTTAITTPTHASMHDSERREGFIREAGTRDVGERIVRVTNTRSFATYCEASDFGASVEPLDTATVLKEICMMGLRTVVGIDLKRFRTVAGCDFETVCSETIRRYPDAFAYHRTNDAITVTRRYRRILNRLLIDIFDDIDTMRSSFPTEI